MPSDFMKRGVDYQPSDSMVTLPPEYYRSGEIYREEVEKIFYNRWLMVCREEEISETGSYITVEIGEENIIVVRGEAGEIHAHFNVCRHRGTRMCTNESGCFENGVITCPYHAWQYALEGTLNAAPMMGELNAFEKDSYPLYHAHVGRWGGFVFINLADDPKPFEQDLSALIGKFQDWQLPELRIAHKIEYQLNCNWKLILQNYQECYHCPGVHPVLSKWTPFRGAVHDCFEGPVIGGYMEMTREGGGMTMDGHAAGPPVCQVSGDNLRRVHYYSVFPNLLLSPHPDYVLYHRIRSLAVDQIQNDCFFLLHPDVISDPVRMERFGSAVAFWDMTNLEDWKVCQQMQQGLRSRRFNRGRYSAQEDILFALDKEVLRALGHTLNSHPSGP